MDENQYYTIILRHDTSTLWMTNDPVLRLGELGMEDDTHKVKRGDGESKWSELPYEDFGLIYIVTFENLHGDLEENETLVEEFNKKISKKTFEDVGNKVVAKLILTSEEEGEICRITKFTKDVETNGTVQNVLRIFSSDNSVQGYWSLENGSERVLDLVSRSAIKDYEPTHTYFKDQICYYHNKLYRAYQDLVAGPTFNENQWVLLASLHSNDIKYDNLQSGLDAENVKDALDELKRRDDRKVQKSTEERIVYGTDSQGQQTVIPIDDLRKVDTVNHKQADLSKNVQIDASDINYSDADPSLGTIRKVLDSKVDKTFAGHGAKIVRDVRFTYNETTGHIALEEDKVSPEDGTSDVESVEIDVVSEQELATTVTNINTRITDEVNTLNNRINTEVDTLNNTINTKETEIYTKIQEEHDEINDRVDREVDDLGNRITTEVETLNNTINTKEQALQEQINTNASEITRVETESQERDTALDTRINQAVNTLNNTILHQVDILNNTIDTKEQAMNDRVDEEVETLNNRITDEVDALNTTINEEIAGVNATILEKETAMDNKKIDKDIAETIVTGLEVATHDRQPTIKITNKNTTSKTANYDYLHFGTVGAIKTRMEDADHIIIDSTDIDTMNTQQNERLTNAENRLTAHDGQIATLLEHDVNHDRHLETIDAQILNHETRLDTDEANITQLQQDLETEATTRENSDNALSQRITTNAVNITTKADKIFAQDTNNHVVGKIESDNITGNTILNLKETMVSPQDNSSMVERIRIISSDGTVVATRDSETGVIDIRTNLDTDVNYFVTPEIISTTIADETTLDMTQLTPTDKINVEVQDIISDPEGTWGRVKSIDTDNETCVVVTFKKHAQAVWGTIKGTLADQSDLQTALTNLQENIDDESTARESADQILQENIDSVLDGLTQEVQDRQDADATKVDKTSEADKVYGTDSNGEQTTYNKEDFGKVDTVNGVQADANKNVEIVAQNINVYRNDDTGHPENIDFYSVLRNIAQMSYYNSIAMSNIVREYNQGNTYSNSYTTYALNDTTFTLNISSISFIFVTFTRNDGVMLMARVLQEFVADNTQPTPYESFMHDVEQGYLKLVGIPEQHGDDTPPSEPNWQSYTTVQISSVTSGDNSYPVVDVYQDTNGIYNVGFQITNPSQTDNLEVGGVFGTYLTPNQTTQIFGFNFENDYTYYDNENAILEKLNFTFEEHVPEPDWQIVNTFTLNSPVSRDNITPIVGVYEDINGSTENVLFKINNNSSEDELEYSYTGGDSGGIPINSFGNFTTNLILPRDVDQTYVENNFSFEFLEPQPEPDYQEINSFTLNSPLSSDNEEPDVRVIKDINEIDTDAGFTIYNNSTADILNVVFVNEDGDSSDYSITPSDNYSYFWEHQITPENIDLTYIENHFTFSWETSQDDPEETFNILNDVMGTPGDTYDGLGGTEEEVEQILDDILGNG